jgi:hypothetical protein
VTTSNSTRQLRFDFSHPSFTSLANGIVRSFAPLAAIGLMLLATSSSASASSREHPNSWSDYEPTKLGQSCHLNFPPQSSSSGTVTTTLTGNSTKVLKSIEKTSKGTVVTESDTIRMDETQTNLDASSLSKQVLTMKILLKKNGTLQSPIANGITLDNTFHFESDLIYPSIPNIRKLQKFSSTVAFSFSSRSAVNEAAIEKVTVNHEKTIDGRIGMLGSGLVLKTLTTPAGTFHNLVGIRTSYAGIKILNIANSETASELSSQILSSSPTTTYWYAPGRGAVSMWSVSSTGQKTVENVRCSG